MKENLTELIRRYKNGECNAEEVEWLLKYIQSEKDLEEMDKIVSEGLLDDLPESFVNSMEFQKMADTIHPPKINHVRQFTPQRWLKIAAAILIFFSIAALVYTNKEKLFHEHVEIITASTLVGEKRQVTLADGTTVWLSPSSQLTYPVKFTKENREVHLEGEAFFDVKSDTNHPFIIKGAEITTTVLGTTLNVTAYTNNSSTVTLLTGKARVNSNSNDNPVTLKPNQKVAFGTNNTTLIVEEISDPDRLLARRNGIYQYNGSPMSEVIDDLQNAFGLKININGSIKGCVFYGEKKPDVDALSFLENVCIINNKTLKSDGETLTISGSDCIN